MVGDCAGDGTTSQSCATAGLIEGAEIVYIACRDAALNADTIATNEHLDYVVNTPPVADAGPDQSLIHPCVPAALTLDGSASSDADSDPLTYSWWQTGGPAIELSSSTVQMPTFTPISTGTYIFSLIVNDGIINSATDSVTIITDLPPGAVPLGSACTFGVMAIATITNTGLTAVNGDMALNPPGVAITGFALTDGGPGVVTGTIHNGNATSALAKQDLLDAYNFAKGLTPALDVGAVDLGALGPLLPGVYSSASTMSIATNLVLDGGGDPNAVWVFQIGSSIPATTASVSLTNSAQSRNVFWVPTSSATIGAGTTFAGTILAGVSVTCDAGAIINGRVFAGATTDTGAVTMDANTINVPLP
jgi:hypothetical protein